MTNTFKHSLMLRLPEDIVRENIMPFVYNKQDPILMNDIRNYHETIEQVENYYFATFDEYVLYRDIITFCNLQSIDDDHYEIDIEKLFKRQFGNMHLQLKNHSHCEMYEQKLQLLMALQTDPEFTVSRNPDSEVCFILSYCYRNNTKRFVQFLWGLMTSYERTCFMDKYVPHNNKMDEYINKYDTLTKIIVYDFRVGYGGIGDCIKFFLYILKFCIENNIKLYYKINNIPIEKYLQLKHHKMYIDDGSIGNRCNITSFTNITDNVYHFMQPHVFYNCFSFESVLSLPFCFQEVFTFADEVPLNIKMFGLTNLDNYISIHLRMGDKFLETDKSYVHCKNDVRSFDEHKLFQYIEENLDKNIVFFCDNNNYKLKIKNKYNNVVITYCDIGHTSLYNTTYKQTLDAITEFYLIANSDTIGCASYSGFPIISSKFFKDTPLVKLY